MWQNDRGQQSALLSFIIFFQGYLSIGIASVERPSGANYLLKTTQSLIDNMSEEDEKNAIIVIFLADIEESPKSRTKKEIARMFEEHISKGLLIVIEASSDFYPALENINQNMAIPMAEERGAQKKMSTLVL